MANEKRFVIQELVKHDEQGKPVHREVEIPDGRWVVEVAPGSMGWEVLEDGFRTSEETKWSHEVVGPKPTTEHLLRRLGLGGRRTANGTDWHRRNVRLLVCDQPFGVINVESESDNESPARRSSLLFEAARQIHKGELGQFPPFPSPRYAREGRELDGYVPEGIKCTRKHDLRRHHARWARLVEVAALVGMPHEQLVERFYPFADAVGRGLPVLFAATREEIDGRVIPHNAVRRFEIDVFPELFDRNPATIWVRQGFAKTVLCLHHLGYKPNATPKVA